MSRVDNSFRRTLCPLCSSPYAGFVGKLCYKNNVPYSSHQITLNTTPELWKCNTCMSWYSNNILSEADAVRLYENGISSNRWIQGSIEENKPQEVQNILSRYCAGGKKVLDIGCNTGDVLDFAKEKGCMTAGVEVSAACHEHLTRKGHQCFKRIDEINGLFDVIVLFDIVEHIYDLPALLEACISMLAEHGVLIILTGNIQSISARICRAKWWYVNYPEHIVFPSKKFFINMTGVKLLQWIRTYAAINYRYGMREIIKTVPREIINGRYTGLPSIGRDHVLVCLGKD